MAVVILGFHGDIAATHQPRDVDLASQNEDVELLGIQFAHYSVFAAGDDRITCHIINDVGQE
ncbi:hypothetical protein SDC9_182199 [bioreactor metagenome]|uniref:Uncharacterized protein n=1 Tax=bioreactor metagenome TaxID=1076179 RepID=A0A645H6U5_9ZZZZ